MALNLGVMSSGSGTQGIEEFFVSLDKRLVSGDTVSGTPTVVSSLTQVDSSSVAASTAVLSSIDETIVAPIGRAVEFTITSNREVTAATNVNLDVNYVTTLGKKGTVRAKLKIATVVE